jgi:hypothetical protein
LELRRLDVGRTIQHGEIFQFFDTFQNVRLREEKERRKEMSKKIKSEKTQEKKKYIHVHEPCCPLGELKQW